MTLKNSSMRIIVTTLLLGLLTTAAWAQHEVPITANPALVKQYQQEQQQWPAWENALAALPKADCDEPEEAALPVLAGDTLKVQIEIDTFGLDTNGIYQCLNCAEAVFGCRCRCRTGDLL
jgi:hypothetical protein